jgi:hypothetical protein
MSNLFLSYISFPLFLFYCFIIILFNLLFNVSYSLSTLCAFFLFSPFRKSENILHTVSSNLKEVCWCMLAMFVIYKLRKNICLVQFFTASYTLELKLINVISVYIYTCMYTMLHSLSLMLRFVSYDFHYTVRSMTVIFFVNTYITRNSFNSCFY